MRAYSRKCNKRESYVRSTASHGHRSCPRRALPGDAGIPAVARFHHFLPGADRADPAVGGVPQNLTMSWPAFWAAVSSERVVASYKLTFGASLIAAFLNVIFGGIVAWVLVRYEFPGKRIIDALVDLPFALP